MGRFRAAVNGAVDFAFTYVGDSEFLWAAEKPQQLTAILIFFLPHFPLSTLSIYINQAYSS